MLWFYFKQYFKICILNKLRGKNSLLDLLRYLQFLLIFLHPWRLMFPPISFLFCRKRIPSAFLVGPIYWRWTKNVFISPSFLKAIFACYKIMDWQVFFLSFFKDVVLLSSSFHGLWPVHRYSNIVPLIQRHFSNSLTRKSKKKQVKMILPKISNIIISISYQIENY